MVTAEKLTELRFLFENNKVRLTNAHKDDDAQFQLNVK